MPVKIDLADYDAVVADIYEAALSPSHWEVALTNLVNRFGQDRWDIAMLVWEQVTPPAGRFVGSSGVNAVARQAFVHGYAGRHEWSLRGHELPVGTVLHSDRVIDRGSFRQGRFFREYLIHYQLEVAVLALLDRHGPAHLALCLPGPDNGAPRLLEAATRLLLPHIQRATRIARRLGEAELSAASARSALDAAPSAILMCDEALRLTYANPAGEALLAEGYLRCSNGRLVLPAADLQQRLHRIAAAEVSVPCAAFMLEGEGADGRRLPALTAMAMRIDAGKDQQVNPEFGQPQLMIVAERNHRASFARVDHLREWFDLTPAEARLAATIAEGASLEDFATTRGISLNAARFLLKKIFTKTGTNRQPQLVAKLQASPLPWHGGGVTPELPSPIG